MSVIFLDVDGVLNCRETWDGPHEDGLDTLDPEMCDRFARIVHAFDPPPLVVLSSTWRLKEDSGLRKLCKWLDDRGVGIYAHTPSIPGTRGVEVDAWIKCASMESAPYLILDDDDDFLDEQKPFHVKTNWLHGGLTPSLADAAIAVLEAQGCRRTNP